MAVVAQAENPPLMVGLAVAVQVVQRRLEEREIRHLSVQAKEIMAEPEMGRPQI